jgi:hypothetical protein
MGVEPLAQPELQPAPVEAVAAPIVPVVRTDAVPRPLQTQAAYRRLVSEGISSQEAAGLIGYVVGLAPCESHWSLIQVNRLLFLRNLYNNTDWGSAEREPGSD